MKIKLRSETQDAIIKNRASGVPASERTGFVAVHEFRGPRGARYRPVLGPVRTDLDEAIADLDDLRKKRYTVNLILVSEDVVEIDATGAEVDRLSEVNR